MLFELRIRDFAIIESVVLQLGEGFNVLTGETGAGKSIVVGALALLLGERSNTDVIRTGADRALIEGCFDATSVPAVLATLQDRGIDAPDGSVILRREIQASGRSRAWINDVTVTVTALAEVGRMLVNIHGQHEAQSLLDAVSQRNILDSFAGAAQLAEQVASAHGAVAKLDAELAKARRTATSDHARAEALQLVVQEISALKLVPGELERIELEAGRLENAEELLAAASAAIPRLDDEEEGVLAGLARVRRLLDVVTRLDPPLVRLTEILDSAEVAVTELSRELENYVGSIDLDPATLRRTVGRRDDIYRITRKYGGSVDTALAQLRDAELELRQLGGDGDRTSALESQRRDAVALLDNLAAKLSRERKSAATRLRKQMNLALSQVGLDGGEFQVELNPLSAVASFGLEEPEFLVRLNKGAEPRSLSRVASGGELSRIMLSLKTILADFDRVPSLVFDEVDAGIGGQIAIQVGDALRTLAANFQILVITHLPQIASRAHVHLVVAKAEKRGVTTADIAVASGQDRELEIARMLSGDSDSNIARKHASQLLKSAAQ